MNLLRKKIKREKEEQYNENEYRKKNEEEKMEAKKMDILEKYNYDYTKANKTNLLTNNERKNKLKILKHSLIKMTHLNGVKQN
jgi:hypothetical protein